MSEWVSMCGVSEWVRSKRNPKWPCRMAESGKFIEPKQLLIKKCSCCQTSSEFGISSHSSCCRFFSIAGHFKVLSLSGNSSETCSTFRAVGIVCSVCFCPEQSCAYGTFLIFRIVFSLRFIEILALYETHFVGVAMHRWFRVGRPVFPFIIELCDSAIPRRPSPSRASAFPHGESGTTWRRREIWYLLWRAQVAGRCIYDVVISMPA